ncbi:tryptophan-rich sensory protein [Microcoleus sp. FACHB-1515]|uniref:tryptophan-rich sensory protein n=1 Tax=Cyanophyceae TaxID=3028117 RepID=UPI001689B1A9|nr:tryptophan-rich sensory protein [Microcoleus sp. FACHB-1515]MBD2092490.1 tryptophan-rich sensory protein [Microcoleus sp. FACHB-1515]
MKSSRADSVRSLVTLIAILGTLAVNTLSNLYPPNGLNIGEIANTRFQNLLVLPANYAFAIWGVIYLGLIGLGVYQVLMSHNGRLRRMEYWLAIACVAQIAWVLLFQAEQFWASVIAIVGILLPLIVVYVRLRTIDNRNWFARMQRVSRLERWLVDIPISVYLAWICVATIVNVASALDSSGWNGGGFSPTVWAIVMLIIGAILAANAVLQQQDTAFAIVFVWAYVAIAVRHFDQRPVAIVAGILAIGLAGLALRNTRTGRPQLGSRR